MIETEFKNCLARAQRSYFSAHLDDDEIFQLNLDILGGMVQSVLAGYKSSVLVKLLSFYLINSKDCKEAKEEISKEVEKFVEFAKDASSNQTEMYVLDAALTDFYDGKVKQ